MSSNAVRIATTHDVQAGQQFGHDSNLTMTAVAPQLCVNGTVPSEERRRKKKSGNKDEGSERRAV